MGTRNLTAVYIDGEYKIAQYGQWDGYPEGQGMTALNFSRTIKESADRAAFAEKVRKCRFITKEEIEERNAKIRSGKIKNWTIVWPELSRDTCADILKMVAQSDDGLVLQNDLDFAADSLFCEWAWVLDLDAGTFEGYEGFNQANPLTEEDRFFFLNDKAEKDHRDKQYHPVKLAAKWSLDNLPTDEDFIAAFKED